MEEEYLNEYLLRPTAVENQEEFSTNAQIHAAKYHSGGLFDD
jgi:hypothetical protein